MFRSLAGRLVATTAGLVIGVTVLIGVITVVGVRAYLTDRLDQDVSASLARTRHLAGPALAGLAPDPRPDTPRRFDDQPGNAVDSLTVVWGPAGDALVADVIVQGGGGRTSREELAPEALALLAALPDDGEAHSVDLPGLGGYRVRILDLGSGAQVAAGMPSDDVDAVVRSLVTGQVVLVGGGALLAIGVGALLIRRHLRPLRDVAATAHAVAELPLDRGRIDLTERVPATIAAAPTEAGQVGRALNVLLDHVEASLASRHASEERVRRFVADASHELRTPLATIAGYTELAQRRPDDVATQQLALGKVDTESKRMTALVEDLLLLARLDAGRPLRNEAVDLTRLAIEATEDARVVGPEHHWELRLPDHAVEVTGDERRLQQVMTNLLTNARKYTPAGSTVVLEVHAGGFSVADDGPGFPAAFVEEAFVRFARADSARQRAGGAGLGLSLVEAIVTAHGGTVSLASQPGATRISVDLPS